MKKIVAMLVMMLLGCSAIAFAAETIFKCSFCDCTKFQQGLVRDGECVCGHLKMFHYERKI